MGGGLDIECGCGDQEEQDNGRQEYEYRDYLLGKITEMFAKLETVQLKVVCDAITVLHDHIYGKTVEEESVIQDSRTMEELEIIDDIPF